MAHDSGMIVIWSGTLLNIPAGWTLCDGTFGTPDLTDRFVPGAGDDFNPGDQGGLVAHNHPFTGDGHFHNIQAGDPLAAGAGRSDVTTTTPTTGTTDAAIHLPPYYALAYIMRL